MISAKINTAKLDKALEGIRQALFFGMQTPEDSAKEYAALVKQNIMSQKFGSFGRPYGGESKGKWKKIEKSKYWYWLGTVYKSIKPVPVLLNKSLIKWRVGLSGYTPTTKSSGTS